MQGILVKILQEKKNTNHQSSSINKKQIIMKTTNQIQENNNLRSVTQKSIVYFGLVSMLFLTSSFGRVAIIEDQNFDMEVSSGSVESDASVSTKVLSKPTVAVESESEQKEILSVLSSNYEKPLMEVIKENESIIESKEAFDFESIFGRSIDEIILENEMIIESTRSDEEFPLDFELINSFSGMNREAFLIKNKNSYKS